MTGPASPASPAAADYAAYEAWCAARDAAAFGPHGLATLAGTVWLTTGADPGVPAEATLGSLLLRRFEREGQVAVRVYDPERLNYGGVEFIERYLYDAAMAVPGRFDATPSDPTPTRAVDGYLSTTVYAGTVRFALAGTELELLAHRSGDDLFAAFSDASDADRDSSYEFRMIRIPAPGPDGRVTVDLNRAYLPPSRFSPHFVCVLPPATNRWQVPVRAGERRIVPRDQD
ncbi:DUF1684 domain-containing protein [Demequina silvatica]|uniref:DUF1684 domain-containing protein n=1 Tax=Demequina silvatica TaxID=1638988 RepID=UPI000784E163|nr:DUF1684 domain-containing protein [Demequina silvatica]